MITVPRLYVPYLKIKLMADTHIGSEDTQQNLFLADRDEIIQNPYCYGILLGDGLQYDLRDSKGDCMRQTMDPDEQEEWLENALAPAANKILAILPGNHENRTKENQKPIRRIARHLDIPHSEAEMYLKIPVGEGRKPVVYTFYGIHGYASGRGYGGVAASLERLPLICDADIYAVAHAHKPLYFTQGYFRPDLYNKKISKVIRHYIACKSYQDRGYYPQRLGLPGQDLGSLDVCLNGLQKGISVIL